MPTERPLIGVLPTHTSKADAGGYQPLNSDQETVVEALAHGHTVADIKNQFGISSDQISEMVQQRGYQFRLQLVISEDKRGSPITQQDLDANKRRGLRHLLPDDVAWLRQIYSKAAYPANEKNDEIALRIMRTFGSRTIIPAAISQHQVDMEQKPPEVSVKEIKPEAKMTAPIIGEQVEKAQAVTAAVDLKKEIKIMDHIDDLDDGITMGFTDRERDILKLIRRGLTNEEISIKLSLDKKTISANTDRIRKQDKLVFYKITILGARERYCSDHKGSDFNPRNAVKKLDPTETKLANYLINHIEETSEEIGAALGLDYGQVGYNLGKIYKKIDIQGSGTGYKRNQLIAIYSEIVNGNALAAMKSLTQIPLS